MDCLVPYSTSEDSEDEDVAPGNEQKQKNQAKRQKLQLLPSAKEKLGSCLKANEDEENVANVEKHQNRIRSFKHERGNWATFVYIPVDANMFDEMAELCQQVLEASIEVHACEDFHITLSRTVVLQYHLIDNFVEALRNYLVASSFTAFLRQIEAYVNTEKIRTFIGFKVDSSPKLLDLLQKVNKVMLDFKLQTFYEAPSFHISFAWCLGNQLAVINPLLETLMAAIENHFPNGFEASIAVKELRCKIGHKIFNFKLS